MCASEDLRKRRCVCCVATSYKISQESSSSISKSGWRHEYAERRIMGKQKQQWLLLPPTAGWMARPAAKLCAGQRGLSWLWTEEAFDWLWRQRYFLSLAALWNHPGNLGPDSNSDLIGLGYDPEIFDFSFSSYFETEFYHVAHAGFKFQDSSGLSTWEYRV